MHLRKFAGDNKALWWFNVIMVKLHNRRDILYEEYNTGSRQINTGNSLITMIKYRKTKITYTDRNDQQCNSKSREECVIECKIKKYIAQYGQYPAQFLIRDTEAINSSLKFSSVNMLGTMRLVDPDCQAKCSKSRHGLLSRDLHLRHDGDHWLRHWTPIAYSGRRISHSLDNSVRDFSEDVVRRIHLFHSQHYRHVVRLLINDGEWCVTMDHYQIETFCG